MILRVWSDMNNLSWGWRVVAWGMSLLVAGLCWLVMAPLYVAYTGKRRRFRGAPRDERSRPKGQDDPSVKNLRNAGALALWLAICFWGGVGYALAGDNASETNSAPSAAEIGRSIGEQIALCEATGVKRFDTRLLTPGGGTVNVRYSFGGGLPGKLTWGIGGGLVGLLALDRAAANNDWLWHKGRSDWAGLNEGAQARVESRSSGSQTTDAGGDNYYAEGDLIVVRDEGRIDSDNE
jgi:hypothetical protein